MSSSNAKVVSIQNQYGDTTQYVKVSARVPEFLKVYGPDKGYRVLSESTDYLDFAQGRKALCLALASQGQLDESYIKELLSDKKVVFKSKLVDKEGNVVAESTALKPVWNLKDFESGETAAFQRLLARLGFGGDIFDSDEENDREGFDQPLDTEATPEASPTQPVTMQPVSSNNVNSEADVSEPVETKPEGSMEPDKPAATPPKNKVVQDKGQGVKVDASKVQPAQLRQLESMARVKKVDCPVVNTPDEFRAEFARLKALPIPG